MNKIDEIKQALAKVSSFPWVFGKSSDDERLILNSEGKYVASVQIHQTPRLYGLHDEPEREANANVIVNSPEWLHYLIGEVERLKENLDAKLVLINNGWEEERYALQEENEALRKALMFYADKKNYEYRTSYLDQDSPIIEDEGERARKALEGEIERLKKQLSEARSMKQYMISEEHERVELENEKLRSDISELEQENRLQAARNKRLEQELVETQAKLNEAIEALEWIRDNGTDMQSIIKARNALHGIEGDKGDKPNEVSDR